MPAEITRQKEAAILDKNWDGDHTRPAVPHYDHKWLWDSVFASIINTRRGLPEKAETEIRSLFNGQDPKTGFIPNINYLTGHNWRDIEALTFKRPDIGSSYIQPPIIAMGTWETHKTYKDQGKKNEGLGFLRKKYQELSQFYAYFANYRENGNGSKLIGNVHPHETGRDSDPSLRPDLPFIPGKGRIAGLINGAIDYGTILKLNVQLRMHDRYPEKGRPTLRDIVDFKGRKEYKEGKKERRYDWDPERVREVYWVNDVMFNCLYIDNLRYMAEISNELGKTQETTYYQELAANVEKEILEKMWNEEDGMFYNLDKNFNQIKVSSITGLFPLMLDNISEHQMSKLVDKMEDSQWFNTHYPIPSVPVNSKYYNPEYTEPRLWKRGEVWINANHLINQGLIKHAHRDDVSPHLRDRLLSLHHNLAHKTEELVSKDIEQTGTTHEFYRTEPIMTRKGPQIVGYRIPGFTWSLLGLHMDKKEEIT